MVSRGLACSDGIDFVVLADHDHCFADKGLSGVSTFAGRGEGALHFFAVHFNHEGLGFLVEGLELALVSHGFAASCEGEAQGKAEGGDDGKDVFHRQFELRDEDEQRRLYLSL
jgi:hypothetical protein